MKESGKVFTFSREMPPASSSMAAPSCKAQNTTPIDMKTEEKKVRFQMGGEKDKKYEGYSMATQKTTTVKGKGGEKENTKDKKLDEEFIHNLHQHIYYLEMQLKLL